MKPLYDPSKGPMKVIGFMSGKGTNLVKLIEYQKELEARGEQVYKFIGIMSDKTADEGSRADEISREFNIGSVANPRSWFLEERGEKKFSRALRKEYDEITLGLIRAHGLHPDVAAFGGYMSIASPVLCNYLLCINVHPAPLDILGPDGKPLYRGDHAVELVMADKLENIRASTHIVTPEVDCGSLLMRSRPMKLDYSKSADENQGALKEVGDWKIFPKTLEMIARGRYAMVDGMVVFDGKIAPKGVALEDIE
jgi:folate-dependent phosphoribosylglycinamide formyltransferase PurN